jgi:hypothetical protein
MRRNEASTFDNIEVTTQLPQEKSLKHSSIEFRISQRVAYETCLVLRFVRIAIIE